MQNLLNIFSLHGKYFNNDENRFTANVLFLLSESRHRFLRKFLEYLKLNLATVDEAEMRIVFQPPFSSDSGINRPDAELILHDEVHILVEAKIGVSPLDTGQLKRYATILAGSNAKQKRLVCVTQVNYLAEYNSIVKEIEPGILPEGTCRYLQWWQLIDHIKESMRPALKGNLSSDRLMLRGKRLDYEERIATLFIREVEQTMYDKKIIDEMSSGDLADVVVQTQEPWFMDVAKRFCIWFPSGALEYGQQPTRYVAYYEVGYEVGGVGNKFPKQIAYMAKIKFIWNRITFGDACKLTELQNLFTDKSINAKMALKYKEEETFHIALTEEPIKLKKPIPLGKPSYARVLSKRRYSFMDLLNASTIDDLFLTGKS